MVMPESSDIHGHDFQFAQPFWGVGLSIVGTALTDLWDRLSGWYVMAVFLRRGSFLFHGLCNAIRQGG